MTRKREGDGSLAMVVGMIMMMMIVMKVNMVTMILIMDGSE